MVTHYPPSHRGNWNGASKLLWKNFNSANSLFQVTQSLVNVDPGYWDVCFNFTAIYAVSLDNQKTITCFESSCWGLPWQSWTWCWQRRAGGCSWPPCASWECSSRTGWSLALTAINDGVEPMFVVLHLNRVPEGHVTKRKVASVNYARQAPKKRRTSNEGNQSSATLL